MSRKRFSHFWRIYICRKKDLRSPSGNFLRARFCQPESFDFLCPWCSDDEDCIGDNGEGSGMLPDRAEVRAWRPPKLLVGNIWLNLIEGESPLRGWLSTVLDGWSLIRHFSTSSLSDRDFHQDVFLHTHLELEDSLIGTGTRTRTRTRRRMKLLKNTTWLANRAW